MRSQPRHGVVAALQLLFGEQHVDLRVARAADTHHFFDDLAIELALVAFVVMPGARNEVVPGKPFLTPADGAVSLHVDCGTNRE